jgi:hypothetical protein
MARRWTAIVILLFSSLSYAQANRTQRVPQSVFGEWAITKFVEVGGHATQTREKAQAQIGKMLRLGARSFAHGPGFLYFEDSCTNPTYTLQATTGEEQWSLDWHDLEQKDKGQILVVRCGHHNSYSFELAKNQELAIYYDGWFFFLKKTRDGI